MPRLDYYAVLEVEPDASDEHVKKAYRRLARLYHPDHHQGEKDAERKIREINAAYEVLSNQGRRKAYDLLRFGGYRQAVDGFETSGDPASDPSVALHAMEETLSDAARKEVFTTLIKDQDRVRQELSIIRERVVATQGYDTFHDVLVRQRAKEVIHTLIPHSGVDRREQLLDVAHQMLLSQGVCASHDPKDVKAFKRQLERFYDEGWIEGYIQACQLYYDRR